MADVITVFAIVIVAIACLMEGSKELIEAFGNAIAKRTIDVPAFVWRILATVYSAIGSYSAQVVMRNTMESTPLIQTILDPCMLFAIIPIVWWLQLQLNMKIVKEYVVPILKKLLNKKLGTDC